MLNFSRLSRRTHRIVKALISCQYSFIVSFTSSGYRVLRCILDTASRMGDEHVVQPRTIVLNEFDRTTKPIG